jgi:hypothetical protein
VLVGVGHTDRVRRGLDLEVCLMVAET